MAALPPSIVKVPVAADGSFTCPPGYAAQLRPGVCAITTGYERSLLGIDPNATTAVANALIAKAAPVYAPTLDLSAAPPSTTTQSPKTSGPTPSTQPGTTMADPAVLNALLAANGGQSNSLVSTLVGGVTGFLTGGPGGAVVGALAGSGALGGGGGATTGTSFTGSTCPPGYYSVGGTCVSPSSALPGGQPFTLPASGTQVASGGAPQTLSGTGGAGAMSPAVFSTIRRRCLPGYRLAEDNLCYKGLSNAQRKWPYHKPYISRGDYKAISRADRARKKLVRLTKKAGAFASMHKPSTRGGSKGVITKAEAARALRR